MRLFLVVVTTIILITITYITYLHWETVKIHFYDYTLIDIVNIVFVLSVSVLITYYSSKFLNDETKKKDVIIAIFEEIERDTNTVFVKGLDYVNSLERNRHMELEIVSLFKQINMTLDTVKEITKDYSFFTLDAEIRADAINLKQKLTDTPFMTKMPYSTEVVADIHVMYQNLRKRICINKLKLFI